jgi:hypothetical protein
MANRHAIATGNWSNPAIWDGGTTIPGVGDVVRLNAFTVTIDQDVSVAEIRNDSSAPAVAGGGIVVASIPGGGRTITATAGITCVSGSGAILALIYVTATSGTLTINADLTQTLTSATLPVLGWGAAGSTVIVNGNLANSGGTTTNQAPTVVTVAQVVTLTVNGDVTGGSGSSTAGRNGITVTANATVTVNGDVYGGTGSGSGRAAGVNMTTTSTVTVNGDVTAGTGSTGYGVYVAGIGLTVTGTITGSLSGSAPGLLNAGSGPVDAQGAVIATPFSAGIVSSSTGVIRVAARRILHASPAATEWTVRDDAGFPTVGAAMVLANIGTGMPAPADVADGVVYGTLDEHTGTMDVGGTVTAAEVWDYLTSDADGAGSMGLRLRDAATVESVGTQLAAATGG